MADVSKDMKEFTLKFKLDDGFSLKRDLPYRINMIKEEVGELDEAYKAYVEDPNTRKLVDIVDALIDQAYFVIGTIELMGLDFDAHWDEVHRANMSKVRGMKASRPDTRGFDMVKPTTWVGPEAGHHNILRNNPKVRW